MTRRKWLWAAVMAVPLAIGGGLLYANARAGGYTCPISGEVLPCPKCCPLNQQTRQQTPEQSYTCPLTGEELPCERCCPLNDQ